MLKFNVRNIFWNVLNAEGSRFYKQSTLSGGHGHQVGVSLTDYTAPCQLSKTEQKNPLVVARETKTHNSTAMVHGTLNFA